MIVATHRACAEFGAPIVNRGGGTSLSGKTVNKAVVIDTSIVVANGFSCKTQLEQAGIGRGALRAAEVMKLARETGPDGYTPGDPADRLYEQKPPAPADLRRKRAAGAIAGGAVVAPSPPAWRGGQRANRCAPGPSSRRVVCAACRRRATSSQPGRRPPSQAGSD